MAGLVLTAEDRAHFLQMMRGQINSAVHRRMNVLLLLDDGWAPRQIAAALFLDETTVSQHRHLYERSGRSGLRAERPVGGGGAALRRGARGAGGGGAERPGGPGGRGGGADRPEGGGGRGGAP